MSVLRERYWILGGRRPIRSVIGACKASRRFGAKKFNEKSSMLPSDRVRDTATFGVVRKRGYVFLHARYTKLCILIW